MKEEWKAIIGFEEYYQISNFGRVKSLPRKILGGNGLRNIDKGILKPTDNGNGYLVIGLRVNGKRKNKYIHRLVAEHFIDNPNNLLEVNHKDFNTKNNCVDNLEWCNRKQNVNYSIHRMRKPRNAKTKTNTGIKYINYKNNHYIFSISLQDNYKKRTIYKKFDNLDDALVFKNEVLSEINYI